MSTKNTSKTPQQNPKIIMPGEQTEKPLYVTFGGVIRELRGEVFAVVESSQPRRRRSPGTR
ncbi:hypothetical protein cgR_5003 [Corynebacterium glutamicum R]|uniref:Uncharacterized protein n=1 Tax=Corynebacterium glutamicum (strain R) TaxID=340322 RepID=A0AB72V872_CORGB|nr:hypothetical protein cgR_5003 [Corynebacterium glutamicum R]